MSTITAGPRRRPPRHWGLTEYLLLAGTILALSISIGLPTYAVYNGIGAAPPPLQNEGKGNAPALLKELFADAML
jgi:hypothetical protein